ncbi:MAG TPA: serine/threonine-protein kinase, partial [Burkholderiaceae bacterium]|nr:serine/threonine-protein kinase [Burkholderiaceae bacterium]
MNEQSIFLAALEIADPSHRADYLSQACGDEPALRCQVDALFAAHERSGEFLNVPALQQIASGASGNGDSAGETGAEHHAPQGEIDLSFLEPATNSGSIGRLRHYDIHEIVGRGGCGIVLKAFDEKLHRIVAIKVMAPELAATSPARKRFLREARATAAIRHENVVSIHAVEEQPLPFLVMEYIDGQTLQQKLDQHGPLDVREVLRIGQQIATGLEAAHAKELIHRDIKPGNILLEDGTDRIKITDFGLARSADDASMTQSGVISGTPLYMSPEQAQAHEIDHRSDLFSLGSVLYVMCSGRPPFRATTSIAVLRRVVEEQPRPIQGVIPEIPQWLAAIIAKLHAKHPDERFASAKEVGDLLARCQSELQLHGHVESLREILPMLSQPEATVQEPKEDGHAGFVARLIPTADRHSAWSGSRRWVAAAAMILVLLTGLGMSEATGITNV